MKDFELFLKSEKTFTEFYSLLQEVTPNKGESQDEFHSRCMSKLVGDEGYEQDQANAICYSYWERNKE